MNKKYFIVSDVHGFFTPLKETLAQAHFELNNPNHYLIVDGDLFDRGSETVALFEFVKSLGDRFIYVKGNHEELLEDCMYEVEHNMTIESNHFSNHTVDTIAHFTGYWLSPTHNADEMGIKNIILKKMKPVMDFIAEKSVYCYEIGDYIITHSWLPLKVHPYATKTGIGWKVKPIPYWNKSLSEIPDYQSQELYINEWHNAMWCNPFLKWHTGYKLSGKTIICGHWNSSYANSLYHKDGVEFATDGTMNYFPFVDEGIIGIDACTAYTGHINCVILEEEN